MISIKKRKTDIKHMEKKGPQTKKEFHCITYGGYAVATTLSEVLKMCSQIRYFDGKSWVLLFEVDPSEKDCRCPDDYNHYFPATQNSKFIGMVNTQSFPFDIPDKSCQYIFKDSGWSKLQTKMLHYKIVQPDPNYDEYKLVAQDDEDDEDDNDYGDTSKTTTSTKKRMQLLQDNGDTSKTTTSTKKRMRLLQDNDTQLRHVQKQCKTCETAPDGS